MNEEMDYIFQGIRFGVQKNIKKEIEPKVVGLKDEQTHTLKLRFTKSMNENAWEITGSWLIHRGAENPQTTPFGALGCIEIIGPNKWVEFNKAILELSGAESEKEASNKKQVKVFIEAVENRPPLIEF